MFAWVIGIARGGHSIILITMMTIIAVGHLVVMIWLLLVLQGMLVIVMMIAPKTLPHVWVIARIVHSIVSIVHIGRLITTASSRTIPIIAPRIITRPLCEAMEVMQGIVVRRISRTVRTVLWVVGIRSRHSTSRASTPGKGTAHANPIAGTHSTIRMSIIIDVITITIIHIACTDFYFN